MRSFARPIALLFIVLSTPVEPALPQALRDSSLTWQEYGRTGMCRYRLFLARPGEERTHVIVIQELAANTGPSIVSDVEHLVELIGRQNDLDPVQISWILHWGSFSFEGASDNKRKELFLRVTFRRTRSGTLGSPSWRVVTREEVEDLTDRYFQ